MQKSPFPGMDPYLEGYLWPDVHNSLANAIKELLIPSLAPKYVARTGLYTVNDETPESEIGILYPDVEILQSKNRLQEPAVLYGNPPVVTLPDIIIPSDHPIQVRIPRIEIRDAAKNRLITAIEILSPVNKKRPGSEKYSEKRTALHESGVHLLEIDLLRRGIRPFVHPLLSKSDYAMFLMRAGVYKTEIWTPNLRDPLPVLPVPLKAPDLDVALDLKAALDLIYTRNRYDLSVDYSQKPPPPELPASDAEWVSLRIHP